MNIKPFLKKLYELVGNSQGVKVTITAIKEKQLEAKSIKAEKLKKAV